MSVFGNQLIEMHRSTTPLNYLEVDGNQLKIKTVPLWEMASLSHSHYFEEFDQKGHILPVFRVS